MKVVTRQFGEIEYSEQDVIEFSRGIIGFESCKRYLVVDEEAYQPFRWLVGLDNPETRFPVLDPLLVAPEFAKELPKGLVKRLFSSSDNLDLFCIVTLNGHGGRVTINLKSPVVLDYDERAGEQLVLVSEELSVAQPIS